MYQFVLLVLVYFSSVFGMTHSFALSKKYLGCFRHFSYKTLESQTFSSESLTLDVCINNCRSYNSTFAGFQEGTRCLCGEDFKELISENECKKECSGDRSQYCGGISKQNIAVYTVCSIGYFGIGCNKVCHCKEQAPCQRMNGKCPTGCDSSWIGQACDTANASPTESKWYVGCYADRFHPRAMDRKNPGGRKTDKSDNPTNFCLSVCARYNYTYMGSQHSHHCFCGESYSRHGPSRSCTYKCKGNKSQICGGVLSNSVYSVCPIGSFSENCIGKCFCLNNTRCVYRNGKCPAGCEPGWTGDSCSVRDCSLANGSCSGPNESCEKIDLKYATKVRCGCNEGYGRQKPWENCTASTDSNTFGGLIGAAFGTAVGMLIIGILIRITIIKCRQNIRREIQLKESTDGDAVRDTARPRESTPLNEYQTLDRAKKETEAQYDQLRKPAAKIRNATVETGHTCCDKDIGFSDDNYVYELVM